MLSDQLSAVVRDVIAESYGKATRVVIKTQEVELELDLLPAFADPPRDTIPARPDPLEELEERFRNLGASR